MQIGVITRVPNPDGPDAKWNLAMTFPTHFEEVGSDRCVPLEDAASGLGPTLALALLGLRSPVFHLGEIMLLDAAGREIGGLRRKPSKWGVECQVFETDSAHEAFECAREVMEGAE